MIEPIQVLIKWTVNIQVNIMSKVDDSSPIHTAGIMRQFYAMLSVWQFQMWTGRQFCCGSHPEGWIRVTCIRKTLLQLYMKKPLSYYLSYWLSQFAGKMNGGDYVMPFRAKNFNSLCLCLLPVMCCWSSCLWKLVLKNHYDSLPSWPRLQWTFPQKTASSERVRQGPLFTDGDYVIILFRAKNIILSFSRMHVGLGSQSQHILTASIWL